MANEDTQTYKPIPKEEIGASGTYVVGGIISEVEYNSSLKGTRGLKIYDQMRRGDATVRASLLAVKLPILAANWFITPASQDEKDVEVADFIERNLFNEMTITWRDFLRQALLHLDYGRMVFEIVYEIKEDGKIGWRKFAPRLPHTILAWEMSNGENGIRQQLPDVRMVDIPIEKLIIFVNEKEGDNWEGVSILRTAYKHWYMKDSIYKIDAIAHERQGLGIPYVKIPSNATTEDEANAEEIVKNIRANEQAYIKMSEGWEFGFIDMKAGTIRNPQATILHHDRQIVKNVLAQFLELGASGATGSYALSEDQSRLFLLSLQAVASHIAEVINKYAIPRLVDLNFQVEDYPKLEFSKIGQVDFEALTSAIQRMSQVGLITSDSKLESYLRDVMDLPELDEEEQAEKELLSTIDDEMSSIQSEEDESETPQQEEQPEGVTASEVLEGAWAPGQMPEEVRRKISEALKKWGGRPGSGGKKGSKGKKKQNPEIKRLKDELRKFLTDKKRDLLERRARGEKISPEESAKIQLEILNKRSEIEDKLSKLKAKEDSRVLDAIIQMKEKIDNAIEKLESRK